MALERKNSADPPEITHGSTCEYISHVSAANCDEENGCSGSGLAHISKIGIGTDNIQAPKPSPQPTSRPAQLHPTYNFRNLKARKTNPAPLGNHPMATEILPINALQEVIRLNRQENWRRQVSRVCLQTKTTGLECLLPSNIRHHWWRSGSKIRKEITRFRTLE